MLISEITCQLFILHGLVLCLCIKIINSSWNLQIWITGNTYQMQKYNMHWKNCVIYLNSNKIKKAFLCHGRVNSRNLSKSIFLSSPELKAEVSFFDHLLSVICSSVRLSVRLSICLSVNFSHFHLLLQSHWANFNQTWHKASLGKGDANFLVSSGSQETLCYHVHRVSCQSPSC